MMFQLRKPYAFLFITLVVLSVYYSSIFAEVLIVDDHQMIEGLINRDGFDLRQLFMPGSGYYFRPVVYLTYVLDKYLWDAHESFMHLENILFHAANSLLVYLVALRVATREKSGHESTVALFAASLFALHPIATEPVNWISGRTDLLAGFFLFLSLYLLLVSLDSRPSPLSIVSAVLATLSFFIAPLGKETAIFWYPAGLLLIYAYCRDDAQRFPNDLIFSLRNNSFYYLLMTAVPVGYFTYRNLALQRHDSGIGLAVKGIVSSENHDYFNKIRISLKVFGFYIKKLILPLPLNFTIGKISNWYVLVGAIGIILCLYLLYKRNLFSSILLMAACIISPALLVSLGRMALAPLAERYLYMPAAFFAMAVSFAGSRLIQKYSIPNTVVVVSGLLILLTSGYFTWQRNIIWQTNLTLFQDCVRQNPDHAVAKNALATALKGSGRVDEANRLIESNRLPESDTFSIVTEINRAIALSEKKDYEGARKILISATCPENSPYYKNYLQNRAYMNDRLMDTIKDEKRKRRLNLENLDLMTKLQAKSGDPYGYYHLGQLHFSAGNRAKAIECFRLAAEKSPESAFYHKPAMRLVERLSKTDR